MNTTEAERRLIDIIHFAGYKAKETRRMMDDGNFGLAAAHALEALKRIGDEVNLEADK